jgi:hypothetical protein
MAMAAAKPLGPEPITMASKSFLPVGMDEILLNYDSPSLVLKKFFSIIQLSFPLLFILLEIQQCI